MKLAEIMKWVTAPKCAGCWDIDNSLHRCRADEDSCIDGKDCPDYVEYCCCGCATKNLYNNQLRGE